MLIAFRADASARIGTGHVVRCLTLADELSRRGGRCVFVSRLHDGHMAKSIEGRGHTVLPLARPTSPPQVVSDDDYAAWLGVETEVDASETLAALERIASPDVMVVDHYALASDWEIRIARVAAKMVVIDDLANRRHHCDVLIDQNFFPNAERRYSGLVGPEAKLLCGPRYALLGPEYRALRGEPNRRSGVVHRVLVYYGGADLTDQTALALRVLSRNEFLALDVDVVVGPHHPSKLEVAELATHRPRTTLHEQRTSLAPLMARADLAIGAGGATTWERCSLGLPSIVTTTAPNQVPLTSALADAGVINYVGPSTAMTVERLADGLRSALQEPRVLARMADEGFRLVDAQGVGRVATHAMYNGL